MIFVDLPVGSGFSYATTQKAIYSDDLQAADHAYEFIRKVSRKSLSTIVVG